MYQTHTIRRQPVPTRQPKTEAFPIYKLEDLPTRPHHILPGRKYKDQLGEYDSDLAKTKVYTTADLVFDPTEKEVDMGKHPKQYKEPTKTEEEISAVENLQANTMTDLEKIQNLIEDRGSGIEALEALLRTPRPRRLSNWTWVYEHDLNRARTEVRKLKKKEQRLVKLEEKAKKRAEKLKNIEGQHQTHSESVLTRLLRRLRLKRKATRHDHVLPVAEGHVVPSTETEFHDANNPLPSSNSSESFPKDQLPCESPLNIPQCFRSPSQYGASRAHRRCCKPRVGCIWTPTEIDLEIPLIDTLVEGTSTLAKAMLAERGRIFERSPQASAWTDSGCPDPLA